RIASIQEGDKKVGNRTRVKVVKNKIAPPFRMAEFDIIFGSGISKEGDILDLGVELDIVEKSGAWFSFNEERIGQGRENVRRFLAEHPDVVKNISDRVKEKLGLGEKKVISEGETH
ncbi:MAG: DNA recombination/repair protein RecA, partial [Deltaproteobacteria bacterium]|nr:DNA recombination/repair protein RecA [Deltaproteobacteria bacterium]